MRHLALASLLLSMSLPAFAVYKCESNGGTTYGDTACPDSKQVDLHTASVAPQAAAKAQFDAQREKAEAARLEKERHKREAAQDKRIAAAAARQKKCNALAQRAKWSEEDAGKASRKSATKAKNKARRAEETYNLQCKS